MDMKTEGVLVMGIETSCDETSVAITRDGREVLSNTILSQIDIHKRYGGVVPEVASRAHIEALTNVIEESLNSANMTLDRLDAIAVTYGPGLVGALLVGIGGAKALAMALGIPLIGVNHIKGHIFANFIEHKSLEPPFLSLIVSGGHTHLVDVLAYDDMVVLGRTKDDAAGEAFDKIARALGLGYPGGPLLEKLSLSGQPSYNFPRGMIKEDNFDFSFSGLKSSVLNTLNTLKMSGEDYNKADIARSFQDSVVEVLVEKSFKALIHKKRDTLVLCGGVAANKSLRLAMEKRAKEEGIRFLYPRTILCTDNGAMISCAGYYSYLAKDFCDMSLNAVPMLKLD